MLDDELTSYWVAVEVVDFDFDLDLGVVAAVFWSTDEEEVKRLIAESGYPGSYHLYPKQFRGKPQKGELFHAEPRVSQLLDRDVAKMRDNVEFLRKAERQERGPQL